MARKKSLHPLLLASLPPVAAGYIRLVERTVSWEMVNYEAHQKLIDSGESFICAFWHSRLLMMGVLQKAQNRDFRMLISDHADGEIIARVIGQFGFGARRGSAANPRKKEKSKGGAAALKALIKDLKNGTNTGITPDGPRGPRQRAQAGVAQLARLSGRPILPMTYSISHGMQLNSWDRFLLPFPNPLAKGVFVFGDPVTIDSRGEDALEQGRQAVEESLNRITRQADEMMGRAPIDPAALPRLTPAEAP